MAIVIMLGGYLIGSILPANYLVRRLTGRTPDQAGDNPGAAASWRLAGPATGVAVGAFDILKGVLPVATAIHLGIRGIWLSLTAVAPVAGHLFPFGRLRGGKGLATTVGVLLALSWVHVLPALGIGLAVTRWKRWVPAVGVVAFPLALITMWGSDLANDRLLAALSTVLLTGIRQGPWVTDWVRRRTRHDRR